MEIIKKTIKKFIPKFLLFLKKSGPIYYYDLVRYYKYSGTEEKNTREKLIGKIIVTYHVIEKGLTMPEPRLGFGVDKMHDLILYCTKFIQQYGQSDEQLNVALGVIFEYEEFHKKNKFQIDKILLNKIGHLKKILKEEVPESHQKAFTRGGYFKHSQGSFLDFSHSRSSIRNYSEKDVPLDVIIGAIDLARNTPSACNRQTSRVYVYTDKEQINKILKVQGGNRGFGYLTNKLIIVTAELGVFNWLSERNQAYVDGGMYAMNILYALHHYEIAACPLNCSTSPHKDKVLRKLCEIKDSEVFITMVSCGYVPDEFQAPASKRYSIDNILTIK